MEVKVGEKYIVVKNRESSYGMCSDIIDIEGEEVKVVGEKSHDGSFDIEDKTCRVHSVREENLEQITNIEEDKAMEFKVGDKVKVVNKDGVLEEVGYVDIGDTAVIEDVDRKNYKLRMDKDKDFWYAEGKEIELIKGKTAEAINVDLEFEGTTTTAKTEGCEGVAKLYHGEQYSKGYGIAVALGRAMGIDIVDAVLKVSKSYEVEKEGKVALAIKDFAIGDRVRVRTGLVTGEIYDDADSFTRGMVDYTGREFIIASRDRNKMRLEGIGYNWTPSMLELVKKAAKAEEKKEIIKTTEKTEFKTGDRVKVVNTDGQLGEIMEIGDIATVKEVISANSIRIIPDSDKSDYWYADPSELELLKESAELKIGDKVELISKAPKDGFGRAKTGDIGEIRGIEGTKLSIDFPNHRNWYGYIGEVKLVEESPKEIPVVKAEFHVGDKVRIRSWDDMEKEFGIDCGGTIECSYSFTEEMRKKCGKEFVVTEISGKQVYGEGSGYTISTDMIELVEAKKIEVEEETASVAEKEEFKVGDYIYFIDIDKEYDICKIEEIKGNELWGHWISPTITNLPKTVKEFDVLEKSPYSSFMNKDDSSIKKLVLLDNTVEGIMKEFEEGKVAFHLPTELEKTELVKYLDERGDTWCTGRPLLEGNTGVKEYGVDLVYFGDGRTGISYGDVDYAKSHSIKLLTIAALGLKVEEVEVTEEPATEESAIKVGDKVTKDQAIEILDAGGKIRDDDDWIYFREDGVLKYKDETGEISISGGYGGNLNGKLAVESLAVTPQVEYEVGQTVSSEIAEEIVKAGGRVKKTENDFEYYLKDGELVFDGNGCHSLPSGGYKTNFTVDFEIINLKEAQVEASEEIKMGSKEYKVGQVLSQEEVKEVLINGGKVKRNDCNVYSLKGSKLYFANSSSGGQRPSGEIDNIEEGYSDYVVEEAPKHYYEVEQDIEDEDEVVEFIKLGGKVEDEDGWIFHFKNEKLISKDDDGEKNSHPNVDQISVPAKVLRLPKIKIVKEA